MESNEQMNDNMNEPLIPERPIPDNLIPERTIQETLDCIDSIIDVIESKLILLTNYLTGIRTINIFNSCLNQVDETINISSTIISNLRTSVNGYFISDITVPTSESVINEPPVINEPIINEQPVINEPPVINTQIGKQRNIESIKIKLDMEHNIDVVTVRYAGYDKYISIPFELKQNPTSVQRVIDTWFDIFPNEDIVAKHSLYQSLETYYQGSRKNNRSANWFELNTEWVKFGIDGKPCGYKRFTY